MLIGLHQGSVLSPLLCIIVLEALSRENRSGCPEELLFPDGLTLVCVTLQSLQGRLEALKGALELKCLRVNIEKTKTMISSENAGKLTMDRKVSLYKLQKGCRQ